VGQNAFSNGADVTAVEVTGHTTQTSNILNIEKSDGTDLLSVTNTAGTLIRGTTTNDSAATGIVGEYIESIISSGTAYPATNTWGDLTSISLTAGDWDVQFNPVFTQDTSLTTSGLLAGVSSSSATLPSGAAERAHSPSGPNGNSDLSIAPPVTRISLASTTTIYGVATGIFSAGTMSAYGFIRARRVR
jgi:hypothetical protein